MIQSLNQNYLLVDSSNSEVELSSSDNKLFIEKVWVHLEIDERIRQIRSVYISFDNSETKMLYRLVAVNQQKVGRL